MGAPFDRWLKSLSNFQRDRSAGRVPDSWSELDVLAKQVDSLATDGLDSRAAAAALLELERSALHFEERNYAKAFQIANTCEPSIKLLGPVSELFHANRELMIGNIYLVRDNRPDAAAPHFERAIAASGPATPLVAGHAAINLGICQSLFDQHDQAIKSYEFAREIRTRWVPR